MFRRISRGFIRSVSCGLTLSAAGLSFYFLHQCDYDISSIGLVRLARAGIAVNLFFFFLKKKFSNWFF